MTCLKHLIVYPIILSKQNYAYATFYTSIFLWPLNGPRNSIFDSVFKLNLWGAKLQYQIHTQTKPKP